MLKKSASSLKVLVQAKAEKKIAAQRVTANTLVAFMIAPLIERRGPMQLTLFLTAFFTHRVE
jgi:hypothetical protein